MSRTAALADGQGTDSRIYRYDNVKFVLIFLVVLGHLVQYFTDDSSLMRGMFLFCWTFHIPMFMFLSGLFQKRYDGTVRFNRHRFLSFIVIGFVFKFAAELYNAVGSGSIGFELFYEKKAPWFMFALAAYILLMYIFRDIKPGVMIPFSIALACFAGYDGDITHFLCLSRIIVFFPFYAVGYYLKPEQLEKFLKKKAIKIVAVIVIIFTIYLSVTRIDAIYGITPMFTAIKGYDEWALVHGGALLRLACYGISTAVGFSVMAIVPNVKAGYLTYCGSRTLQVYFWHKIVLVLLGYTGLWQLVFSFGTAGEWGFVVISFALVLLLSVRVFQFPTEYILKKAFLLKNQR